MPSKEEKDTFSLMIEEKATQLGISYMEMIVEYCTSSGMEIEVAASLLNSTLKARIELEARDLRFLPKMSVLPL
jgi:hypothetical protein